MTILTPIWLLLIIPLAAAHYVWPLPTRLLTVMRWLLLILILLGIAGLAVRLPSRSGTVVIIADRSRSMPADSTSQQLEAIERIHAERSPNDKLAVVTFGQQATVEHPPQDAAFGGFNAQVGQDASNLNDALDRAIGLIGPDSPGRILLLSDGRWTGTNPEDAAATAATRGIPLDFRLLQRSEAGDLAVDALELPDIGYPAEAFLIGAWVRSPAGQEINYQLRRGETLIASGTRQVPPGLSRLIFRDAVNQPTTAEYTLTVNAADGSTDPVPENNRARALLGIDGPRPILLVTEKPNPQFARLLRAGGLSVQTHAPSSIPWSLETLSAYSSVILEEVPADRIGNTGLQLIGDWVANAGTGLMMTGGKHSYGTGNYFHSPMEEVLPVSMEMRQEHRKHRVAIVVALDRSGSMAVPVAGGKTKMDLADLAAAQALDMLTPGMDEFGVLAVDSASHLIADLQTIPANTAALKNRILSIDSQGGGIFVFEALKHAADILSRSTAGARHIILFADAADAEQPGQYKELLAQARLAGITCSVIGLGTERDVDAEFLKDVARRGDGRAFFTEDPNKLPQLFQQDTFVVARTSFVEDPTPFQTTAALHTIASQPFNNPPPPPVGGYNLTYLKEGATLAAVTADEEGYNAPIIASWQYHAGRVLAYTAQTDGQFTGPIANWPQVGSMLTSLARWTAGESTNLPDNMVLTQTVNDGIADITLHLDPNRTTQSLEALPTVTVMRGRPGLRPQTSDTALTWSGPDSLSLHVPLNGEETVLANVAIQGTGTVSLPPVTLPYSPEYKPVADNRGEPTLRRLAAVTNGQQRINLADIWSQLPRKPRLINLSPFLLSAAVLILLLEVFERRTGILSTGRFKLTRDAATQPQPAHAATHQPAAKPKRTLTNPFRKPQPSAAATQQTTSTSKPSADQPTQPQPAAQQPKPESIPAQPPKPAPSIFDALGQATRQANQRTGKKK